MMSFNPESNRILELLRAIDRKTKESFNKNQVDIGIIKDKLDELDKILDKIKKKMEE